MLATLSRDVGVLLDRLAESQASGQPGGSSARSRGMNTWADLVTTTAGLPDYCTTWTVNGLFSAGLLCFHLLLLVGLARQVARTREPAKGVSMCAGTMALNSQRDDQKFGLSWHDVRLCLLIAYADLLPWRR